MNNLPSIDNSYLLNFLTRLLNTPSPAGLAEPAENAETKKKGSTTWRFAVKLLEVA